MNSILAMRALLLGLLTDAIAVGGSLEAPELGLFQNNVVFDPDLTVIGDLDEADYTGYAKEALTWDQPSVSDDGNLEMHASQATFRPTDAVTPNDIYGWFLVDAGGALIAGGNFDTAPLPMNNALDVIKVTLQLRPTAGGLASVIS